MRRIDHLGFDDFNEEMGNHVTLLTEECTIKYGDRFGRLLVNLATRKYGKYILDKTSEQIYDEYGDIVAQELGCMKFERKHD